MRWDKAKYKSDGYGPGRDPGPKPPPRVEPVEASPGHKRKYHPVCELCDEPFPSAREKARYCPNCRNEAKQRNKRRTRQAKRDAGLPVT